MTLNIDQCPLHKWFAISINNDTKGFGTRVTPSKCCGQWKSIKQWSLTPEQWRELSNTALEAAKDAEKVA